jgi:hypothetical protein
MDELFRVRVFALVFQSRISHGKHFTGYPPPPARVVPYVMTQMRIVVPFNHESRDNHQPPRQTTTILTIRFTCQVF